MERFSEVSQHPRLAQLDKLVEQQELLAGAIEADNFADANVKEQYEQALEGVRSRVDDVLIDGSAVQELERIRSRSEAAKEQLENLAEIVGEAADPEMIDEHTSRINMVTWALGEKATEGATSFEVSQEASLVEEDEEAAEKISEIPELSSVPTVEEVRELEVPSAEPEKEEENTLSLRDMAFIALRTEHPDVRKALAYYKVPQPRLTLIKEVKLAAQKAGVRGAADPRRVNEERHLAWERLEALLDDEDTLLDLIDSTEEDSTEERFLDYFAELEAPDKAMMLQILTAQTHYDSGSFDLRDAKTQQVFWSPDWTQPAYVEEQSVESEIDPVEVDAEDTQIFDQSLDDEKDAPVEVDESPVEGEVIDTPLAPAQPETVNPEGDTTSVDAEVISIDERREKKQRKIPKAVNKFLNRFDELCESFNEHCELDKDATFSHAQLVAFPGITGRMVGEALAAGVLSVREGRQTGSAYTVKDLFLVWTWDKTKNGNLSLKAKGQPAKILKELLDERIENLPSTSEPRANRR